MSATLSMPRVFNPHLLPNMSKFGRRRMFAWMLGANDRYVHALKPRKPQNLLYLAGWNSTRPNGDLTK
jgi:hypothetical protein